MGTATINGSGWCVKLLRHRFPSTSFFTSSVRFRPTLFTPISFTCRRLSTFFAVSGSKVGSSKETPFGFDATTEEEYASQSKLLQEFTRIPGIDKAWTVKSKNGQSRAMFSISQPNLLADNRKQFILSTNISKETSNSVNFQWAPFPVEMTGVSTIVPSPSGSRVLVVRNPENESPVQLEIWGPSQVEKEFYIPQSIHGSIYTDGWFEGISWRSDEALIAYVAEEPSQSKPTFTTQGYQKGVLKDKDCGIWKGQGEWKEDWGETYTGKRHPALFVINIDSGEVQTVKGIDRSLSVGQVVWAPAIGLHQYLVFVGWSSDSRKLGMKYSHNRPCALYAVQVPDYDSEVVRDGSAEDLSLYNLTQSISSAFFPRFSPDGNFLVFISAKSSVDSGVHCATNSLHRIDWPTNGELSPSLKVNDVIPVINCAEDGCFPGLYPLSFPSNPWLSDGSTIILHSVWGSSEVILSVNILSGEVIRISPNDSNFSWNVLTLDGDNIVAVSSSPVDLPQIKYGCLAEKASKNRAWSWLDISNPVFQCSDKVRSLLSSLQFSIMKNPVRDVSNSLTKGASKPFEAIFVSSNSIKNDAVNPLIVILHGRGSIGFGEEALQSLPGKIGSQDVNDVLTAIDHVIDKGLASPSKIAVLGGSHGGFLTTHLIGQTPEKFVAAVAMNPVCNLALMVGTTDTPDWAYVEANGSIVGKNNFTEAPTPEHLIHYYSKSPISHLSNVKTPTLFLLAAKDLRVPFTNGLQYARALKEKGVEVKIILFPEDFHELNRPRTEFESFLNIGVWFNRIPEANTAVT